MLLKIDTREAALFAKCQTLIENTPKFKERIQLVSEMLPLGDIIVHNDEKDCVIFERKSVADFAASIRDGRYEEQSYRLDGLAHHPNHNIVYLIEGDISRFHCFKNKVDKQTLYSAMCSILYFKGFSVMRSNSVDETAAIVCAMANKIVVGLKDGKTPYYRSLKEDGADAAAPMVEDFAVQKTEKDYCNTVVKKVKKDNITRDNIGEIMLCQIPGVSSLSALAILAEFKTLPALIQAIQEDKTCLNQVVTTDAKGKLRKLNKTTVDTIVAFLSD